MARDFNGTNAELSAPDSTVWDSLTAITVGVWIWPDSLAARSDFITRWGNSPNTNRSWNLLQGVTASRAEFFISDGTTLTSSTADTANLVTTGWQLIGGSWESGDNVRLWRDGVNTASSAGTVTGALPNNAIQPKIGNTSETTARWFNGKMGVAFIYNVKLSSDEWIALANRVHPVRIRPQNLISCVDIWGAASPEPDLVSSRVWTLAGTAPQSAHPPVQPPFFGQAWTPYTAGAPPVVTPQFWSRIAGGLGGGPPPRRLVA